jgi:tetratricopeptide (TPR) repeat protein
MLAPIDRPVVCPVIIGREQNLTLLDGILGAVGRGEGQTVLLAGEAGVGKSRMVSEIRARAGRQGLSILQGNCFDTDRSLPYAPILDMLRGLLATQSAEQIASHWEPNAAEMVKLLPELQARIPGLTPAPPLDPEQEKRLLFEAISSFLSALSLAGPLLVVIEDLQWANEIGLDFLLHLARHIAHKPVLLLITYRSDEVRHLSHFLAALDRERLASEMRLQPLPVRDVDLMMQAIFELKRPTRGDFLEAIYSLTEGNAFFIEEVLKSLTATGDIFYADGAWERKPLQELHIPRTVKDAVQRRADGLSAEARHTLALAAVVGRGFDFALLQALTGYDEGTLLAILKELISAQLVVEESVDRFAFRHALTRQAVYSDLLARERKSLHRTIADTMLAIYAGSLDTHVADLAYHCFEAGMWQQALEYSRLAGEQAQALYSPRAAIEQFTRAIEAAGRLGSDPPASLYRRRGQEYETLGDFDLALADYRSALALSHEQGDSHSEWEAQLDLGKLWAERDYGKTGEYFRQAIELARTLDDPDALGHSLNRVGNWYANVDRPYEGISYHQEALGIFESLNDKRGMAESADLLGMTTGLSGDMLASAVYYRRAIQLFNELDGKQGICSSMAMLPLCTGATYHTETFVGVDRETVDGVRECLDALQIARDIDWRSGEAFSLWMLGFCLGLRGDYGIAIHYAEEAMSIAGEIGHSQWLAASGCSLGSIYTDVFAFDRASTLLEETLITAEKTGSIIWTRTAAGILASCCALQGDFARAESVLQSSTAPDSPSKTLGQRRCWQACAELALMRSDYQAAIEIVDRLYTDARNVGSEPKLYIPRLGMLRGQALLAMGRVEEAEAWLVGALEGANVHLSISLVWRIKLALGKVYASTSRPQEAERAFAESCMLIEQLAATLPDEELRAGYLSAASKLLPPKPSLSTASSMQVAPKSPGGLTSRELEVAMLVARGKTNREIAEALVLGERTVETHVGNVLSKLGFTSRAQIAAWAVETLMRNA